MKAALLWQTMPTLAMAMATACVSIPSPTDADLIIKGEEVPGLCNVYLSEPAAAFTPDGTAIAWNANGTLMQRDLATGNVFVYPNFPAVQFPSPLNFSPDNRYLAIYARGDYQARVWSIDRTTLQLSEVLDPNCTNPNPALSWGAEGTFALTCGDYSVDIFDAANPNGAVTRVAPPNALKVCSHPLMEYGTSLDAVHQNAATICTDDNFGANLVAWSYADGVATVIAQRPTGIMGANPLLAYPDFRYVDSVVVSPGTSDELLVNGMAFFTADASDNLAVTRMLTDGFVYKAQYNSDGTEVVASLSHGFSTRLQAWRLSDGPDPYFVSRGNFLGTFMLSNNGVLGACDLDGNLNIWHLHR